MNAPVNIAQRAPWLRQGDLQNLLSVLGQGDEQAMVAGGAVRNALFGQPVIDIDIATTTLPDETMRRGAAAGFKVVPTGRDHGTITLVAGGTPYEVTTLRADIETDGRHARVRFGRNWQRDAERRDFTINGLYAAADGTVVDHVGGLADIETRTIRFIGDADARIREDYLRVLRFFRFFAWYGSGRPDAAGLVACARHKDGVEGLSAKRQWAEIKKLLSAPDPSRALLWMRQSGVLTKVLPETEKWGIDSIHALITAQQDLGWPADPLLRLEAIVPPDAVRMGALARRLRLSTVEAERLKFWAHEGAVSSTATERQLATRLYTGKPEGIADRLKLALATARGKAVHDNAPLIEAGGYSRLLAFSQGWKRPVFPVKGGDLKQLGVVDGPDLGRFLALLEQEWVASGFLLGRDTLLARAAEIVKR